MIEESIIASHAIWIKRFLSGPPHKWKALLDQELRPWGGRDCLLANVSTHVGKDSSNPFFYCMIKAWSEFTVDQFVPTSYNEILQFPLWGNNTIVPTEPKDEFLEYGFCKIRDLLDTEGRFLTYADCKRLGLPNYLRLKWIGVKNTIPEAWKHTIISAPVDLDSGDLHPGRSGPRALSECELTATGSRANQSVCILRCALLASWV